MAPPAVNKARPIPIIQGKEILSLERELGIIQLSVISYQLSVISYQLSVELFYSRHFPTSPPPHFIIHNS
ncbi:MAG: hypothetical protein EWV91_09865 [Microcystis aeruginosa Ma_QC_Ca_00000000_S207]|uniref:Uncharacterized protein n=1 Tax=Microcystis aeruginosa Ma_QC_Ca_00000000_S207 TaxID=2486251 RepID=A0A552FMY2_MICAE|nr:MAG: hypothetical protein EWV91_09865 [Microcystis aeruginosa Ma_QC_Ca_00000000_S207]